MHLFYFLIVIVSLACGSLPPSTNIDLVSAATATVGMVTAWVILCHVAARTVAIHVRDHALEPIAGADWLEKQLAAFRWIGLGVAVLCLAGFGLARVLGGLPVVGTSMSLQAVILLAPAMIITMATWSAEHRYGVLLKYAKPGIGPHFRSVWQSFRGGVAWLVAPVVFLLGVSDLIAMLPISPSAAGVLTLVMIGSFVPLGLPWLIRHLFKTDPLDIATADWIDSILTSAGVHRTRTVRWNTGGQSFNAMVAGFVPPLRTLLLSDRLLDQLPKSQIGMVVLHEAAHLRRRHVPMRMAAIIPAWGVGALISSMAGDHAWGMIVGSIVGIALTMAMLRLVAYRTEFDADVQACKMAASIAGQIDGVPDTYDAAADALAAALLRVTFDSPSGRKATWLHPGVADRIAWLRRNDITPTTNNVAAGTIAKPA